MHIVVSKQTIQVLNSFRIYGNLRFLSHAETIELFVRALVRSGADIAYSQGFNPHPKLSLPLPRPVGIESEDDLLCVKINSAPCDFDPLAFSQNLASQLPAGIDILKTTVSETLKSPQPLLVSYVLNLKPDFIDQIEKNVQQIQSSEVLNVLRNYGKKGASKIINIRDFLKTLSLSGKILTVQCDITPGGTARVDEILELLHLDQEKLEAPVIRKNIQWKYN